MKQFNNITIKKGFLLVIDGIDGSGKSTQVELLKQYLASQGQALRVEVINFPRYGQNLYADLITKYLEGEFGSIHTVSPYLMALAYAGDRLLAKPLIESWLNSGKIVIANRYVSASKAHMGANLSEDEREEFMEWIDNLEYKTNKMPKPDLSILLKVDPKVGQDNALHKNKPDVVDIHEENSSHLEKAAQIYLGLSKAEENWVVVDCMKDKGMESPDKIHEQIVNILKGKVF